MPAQILTQSRLKELLHYCPETGVFTWIRCKCESWNGKQAGTKSGRYRMISINGIDIQAHRLAFLYMDGALPELTIDHINGESRDNRFINLRIAGQLVNGKNRRISTNNKSGVNGVYLMNGRNKWRARVMVDGIEKHLGCFHLLKDAEEARKKADKKYGFTERHGSV